MPMNLAGTGSKSQVLALFLVTSQFPFPGLISLSVYNKNLTLARHQQASIPSVWNSKQLWIMMLWSPHLWNLLSLDLTFCWLWWGPGRFVSNREPYDIKNVHSKEAPLKTTPPPGFLLNSSPFLLLLKGQKLRQLGEAMVVPKSSLTTIPGILGLDLWFHWELPEEDNSSTDASDPSVVISSLRMWPRALIQGYIADMCQM